MTLYGIWCKESTGANSDWLRESSDWGCEAILAFENKRKAYHRAAEAFGFDTYTQAKSKGWVEVRKL